MSRRGRYTPAQLLHLLHQIAAAGDDAVEAMLQPTSEPGTFQVLYDPFMKKLTENGALPVGELPWRLTPQGVYRQALRVLTSASEGKKRLYGVSSKEVHKEYEKLERVNELLANRTLVCEVQPAPKQNNGAPPPPPPPAPGSVAAA